MDKKVSLRLRVTEEPKLTAGRQKIKAITTGGMRVTITTQIAPMYDYGDELQVNGVFTRSEFEGRFYWFMYFPNVQIVNKEHNFVTSAAYELRNKAKNMTESTLPPVASSLLLGIVLGGRHGIPDVFLEKLRVVSVMHVIAASGMNVSFVAAFLISFLARFLRRSHTLFTAMVGISFYVIVAGFEPSIVRAAIMCSFELVASLLGRQSTRVWTLCLTGSLMLFHSPFLWEDVGFQLSFLSTLGILVVKPLMQLKPMWLNDDITTTLAAQITALPILLGVFGNYGLLSVPANALILWTVPLLMGLGSLAIFVGLFIPPLGSVILLLCYPLLLFFATVVEVFGNIGWVVSIPEVPIVVWFGYYVLLAAIVLGNKKIVIERNESLILKEL